jgi:hypothetical protein
MKLKSIPLFLLMLLIANCCLAQIKEMETANRDWVTVGELKWMSNTKASLRYFVANMDTTYLLYMQDEEKLKNSNDMTVRKYFSIRFSGTDNTAGKLYNMLSAFFNSENRKNKKLEKIFTLGTEMVHVQHYPKLTGHAIMFSTKTNHIIFSEKELKKLFGKRNE